VKLYKTSRSPPGDRMTVLVKATEVLLAED
jgi:hypothetical protein